MTFFDKSQNLKKREFSYYLVRFKLSLNVQNFGLLYKQNLFSQDGTDRIFRGEIPDILFFRISSGNNTPYIFESQSEITGKMEKCPLIMMKL